ncbi:MAG: histidine kinase [Actinomycetota bacterium]
MSRFKPSTVRRVALVTGLASVALLVATLAFNFIDRNAGVPGSLRAWNTSGIANAIANIAVPVMGTVLAVRVPQNRIGWLFLVAGASLALAGFSTAYIVHGILADPGSLPDVRLFGWIANAAWPVALGMLAYLLLLFPDGHLHSRRWRPVGWFIGVVTFLLTLGAAMYATTSWSDPIVALNSTSNTGPVSLAGVIETVAFFGIPLALLAAFASVVVRFRSAVGEERLQLKWFVTAAAFVAVTFAVSVPLSWALPFLDVLSPISLLFLYAALAIAVLRYRLYEIDVVIGRTVVFAVLAAFITIIYVALVVGVGTLVGTSRSPLLSAIAAAVVAVAFQPVRERARRLANRVVYGKRATPYEVLSVFTERAAETYATDDVLPRLVRVLAEGIGANAARVWLSVGHELRPAAAWPDDGVVAPLPLDGAGDLPAFAPPERAFPVRHGGELLGAISVVTAPNDPLGPDREKLAEDVAAQTGLVLRNVRLIEELRESRRRIVTAQDARAKALERNLHDGAQQQLVALAVKQRLAGSLVDRDPAKAKAMLADIQTETQDALETLRDLARGIYPPLLADQGLEAALTSQARRAAVPVEVGAVGVGRHTPEVEAAVYFCCLEALQNVAKYAAATRAWIGLTEEAGTLRFEVRDDGAGFDPAVTSFGTGLQGMTDRLDAIGGAVRVKSAPGEGTTVIGSIPVAQVGLFRST